MGVAEDIYGLKEIWSKLSLFQKMIFSVSACLSATSLLGLSDTIYKFRGIVAFALERWHSMAEALIAYLPVELSISTLVFNYLSLITFTFLPLAISNKAYFNTLEFKPFHFLIVWFGYCAMPLVSGLAQSTSQYIVLVPLLLYATVMIVLCIPPRSKKDQFLIARLLAPPVLALIIALITEGLTRPL